MAESKSTPPPVSRVAHRLLAHAKRLIRCEAGHADFELGPARQLASATLHIPKLAGTFLSFVSEAFATQSFSFTAGSKNTKAAGSAEAAEALQEDGYMSDCFQVPISSYLKLLAGLCFKLSCNLTSSENT